MAKLPLDQLKQIFITGKVPTQDDWINLLDSIVHKDDQVAVDAQVVNTRVAAYDASLKQHTNSGHVLTLGDLINVFQNFDANKVASSQNPLVYDSQNSQPCDPSIAQYNPAVQPNPNAPVTFTLSNSSGNVINSIGVMRRYISFTVAGGTVSFYADVITAVNYGVNPKIKLQD